MGDEYELAELAPRASRRPDEAALASFVPDGTDEAPRSAHGRA
jgi:hypothetical protein